MASLIKFVKLLATLLPLTGASVPDFHRRPFSVIWGYPAENCKRSGHDVVPLLEKYGIIQNSHHHFKGDSLQLLYKPGFYPYINENGTFIHGGLPLKENLEKHLRITKEFLLKTVPKNFSGLGTVDWEQWRPIWERNWGWMRKYKAAELLRIKQKHVTWTKSQIEKAAKEAFETAARMFMSQTLNLGRKLFPKSSWGFYLFPQCYTYNNPKTFAEQQCDSGTRDANDRLNWLWKSSNMLNPSVYCDTSKNYIDHTFESNGRYNESLRVKKQAPETTLIIPYVNINKDVVNLNKTQMASMIGLSVNYGFHGVIIWGSSHSVSTKEKCNSLYQNLNLVSGPYVKQLIDKASNCSVQNCNSSGRCADARFPSGKFHLMSSKELTDALLTPFRDPKQILCNCYPGYKGSKCEIKSEL